jgi:FMN phosphatase YigB (HAD superfamily)
VRWDSPAAFHPCCARADPEIGVLKPNPRGFLHACEIWGLDPQDVLVVGDRAEVDAAGAAAAGMSSVIVSHHAAAASQIPACVVFPSLERLSRVFQPRR